MNITEKPTELPAWDCTVLSYDGSDLVIGGGTDAPITFASAGILLRFSEVSYIECPMSFSHASIRLADAKERRRLDKREALDDAEAYAIEAEPIGQMGEQTFYIVAESLNIENRGEQET